jgi:uncharacterized radical SAM superfamily protein
MEGHGGHGCCEDGGWLWHGSLNIEWKQDQKKKMKKKTILLMNEGAGHEEEEEEEEEEEGIESMDLTLLR